MDFSIKSLDVKNTIATVKTACVVVGVYENKKLSPSAQALDGKGEISAAVKSGDISGKAGTTLLIRKPGSVAAERVLLVGLGKDHADKTNQADRASGKDFNAAIQAAARILSSLGAADALISLPLDDIKDRDAAWALRSAVLAIRENAYRFDTLKSKKEPAPSGVKKIAFAVPSTDAAAARATL
ncbi:MAG: M17 family peptidase N-terminal domain-containing protein, partial [Burkholderiales bacterium]